MSSIKHFLNNDERIIRKYKEKMIKRGHSENEFDNSVEWMKNLDNFEFRVFKFFGGIPENLIFHHPYLI